MNDSPYGLTASVWTNADGNLASQAAFMMFAEALETGTVFLNRWADSSTRLLYFGVSILNKLRLSGSRSGMVWRERQWKRS